MANHFLRDDMEYIVHCDDEGNIIGPISKIHAHLPGVRQTLVHYSTWSMIFHPSSGKYGLQLKNPKKQDSLTAGKWDMGVAGHNCYVKDKSGYRPLDFKETLIKEADEEIGISLNVVDSIEEFIAVSKIKVKKPIAVIFERFQYKTEKNNEFVGLAFIITPTIEVKFKDSEVVNFQWLTPQQIKEFLKQKNTYCDTLPLVFEKAELFRHKYLQEK